jgi:hypothetical protein
MSGRRAVSTLVSTLGTILAGGITFWGTNAILVCSHPPLGNSMVFIMRLTLPPLVILFVYMGLRAKGSVPIVALWLLLGIWLLGPLSLFATAAACKGAPPGWVRDALSSTLFFVPVTLMASAYDGSVFALGASTVFCLALCFAGYLGSWVRRRRAQPRI